MKETVLERMERIGADKKIADFMVKEQQPYSFKRRYAAIRAREFESECDKRGLNCHVSVGGLDSIVLFLFLHSLHIRVPGISASHLEDSSIQRVHKALGIERMKSVTKEDGKPWTKVDILQEFGFPVLSKETAAKIELLEHPSEKNRTVRHAIITGETGEYGGNRSESRMKLAQKWLNLFAGYENENEGMNYKIAPFQVSSKCCYYLKEKPCDDWAREHNSVPYLGLMASEGGRRAKSLRINGCNYFGKSTIRSAPFAIFHRQDILTLALEMDEYYRAHWQEFNPDPDARVETVIPAIYGTIERREDGTLYTTKAQRTGCSMCGFGIHMERRPHRFDLLRERNRQEWEFWMLRCCTDPKTGEPFGWGRVLDWIGVPWRDLPDGNFEGQVSLFE